MNTMEGFALKLGQRIRAARRELGMSQMEFATRIGIARRTQIRYEQGECEPPAGYLIMAVAAGCSIEHLLFDEKPKSRAATPPPSEPNTADAEAYRLFALLIYDEENNGPLIQRLRRMMREEAAAAIREHEAQRAQAAAEEVANA